MNSLAPINGKSLVPLSVDEARQPLAVLFAGYPEPWTDKSAVHAQKLIDAKVSAYLLALQGLPAWAIETAVKDFIQGRVDRKRRDKLPTAEEVAALSREHVTQEAARQSTARQRQDQIAESQAFEARKDRLKTPEGEAEKERVMALVRQAVKPID
ncbi:hypothetical protein EJ076_34865 [Mesorhizobium sp. M7D.F.Ca.US.005.01.1.1]|uniref:hypothetical protein n=1 Tax=Mesorhizobium sp. M7D.F.Ca.US.005.01.1.1 TaxID=2493678 RepID=UPI000F761CC5|nr:hypothetical protein [Mesorhizobium sp. M7D.F.Ca.US.005.01.1.1]AZO45900.1 hypothetical protein EJ076_34865 [Mesorhizobium sp. M7D.F.Ca.US.005.01.1.1]